MLNGFDGKPHRWTDGVERFLEQGGTYCALSRAIQPAGVPSVWYLGRHSTAAPTHSKSTLISLSFRRALRRMESIFAPMNTGINVAQFDVAGGGEKLSCSLLAALKKASR